ncbi:MAG: hypothetical protein AAF307_05160 [Pseudomonadota bacterium]
MPLKSTSSAESHSIRVAARAHLAALRQARRARRGAPTLGQPSAAVEEPEMASDIDQTDADPVAADGAATLTGSDDDVSFASADTADEGCSTDQPDAALETDEDDISSHALVDVAPPQLDADLSEIAVEETSQDEPEQQDPQHANDTFSDDEPSLSLGEETAETIDPKTVEPLESDLFDLPGAGPGLVWMLQNCGVSSLKELAAADPDALTSEMGLVAQILDLGYWIEFAREATRVTDTLDA